MESVNSGLRFVEADRLDTSAGRLDHVVVVSTHKTPLGRLDGVLVDPQRLEVEYLVVTSRGWFKARHYLVPLRTPRLNGDAHELEVDVDAEQLQGLEQVDLRTCPTLSASDLDNTGSSQRQAA
jgi:PRC-barrel domain